MLFNLDTFLPYKLSLATNTVSQSLADEYAKFNITRTQWRILAVLGGGVDLTAGAIAKKTLMDKTTLSRAIKNLIERKLVKRKASQTDGRSSPLSLTTSGRKLFEKITPIVLSHERKLISKISRDDRVVLDRILNTLLEESE